MAWPFGPRGMGRRGPKRRAPSRAQPARVWWGFGAPPPPTERRIEPAPWLCASLAAGALAAGWALALSWRPLPLLGAPPGELAAHLRGWADCALHAMSPRLRAPEAASYARWWRGSGEAWRAAWRIGCAAIAGAAPACLLARPMLRPRDAMSQARGPRRFDGPDAAERLAERAREMEPQSPMGFEIAPGAPFPSRLWARHCLVVGGVGGGKSVLLRRLVDRIERSRHQLMIFDAKSEFTARLDEAALIAPWDERGLAWDVALDARDAPDMERLAEAFIPEGKDPMWPAAARRVFVGCLMALRRTRGDDWGWAEMRDVLTQPLSGLADTLREHAPEAALLFEGSGATSQSIAVTLASFCGPVCRLADAWGAHPRERRISVRQWALGRTPWRQIVLQGNAMHGPLSLAVSRGVVGVFAAMVASVEMDDSAAAGGSGRAGSRAAAGRRPPIWFVADEFPQMGSVAIQALFAMGRSRDLRCVIAAQDVAQVDEVHGPHFARALGSMCGTLVVAQTLPGETADRVAGWLGERRMERPAGAEPGSFTPQSEPLYLPQELASRLGPEPGGVRLLVSLRGDAFEVFCPHAHFEARQPARVRARWLDS